MMVMSGVGGPLIVNVKDGSRALREKTHRSAVPVPAAGRRIITGLPPSTQDEAAMEKGPMAAMFKLTFPATPDPPFVLSSTTMMSLPALVGALGVTPK